MMNNIIADFKNYRIELSAGYYWVFRKLHADCGSRCQIGGVCYCALIDIGASRRRDKAFEILNQHAGWIDAPPLAG